MLYAQRLDYISGAVSDPKKDNGMLFAQQLDYISGAVRDPNRDTRPYQRLYSYSAGW
jgi:hypothetical protein